MMALDSPVRPKSTHVATSPPPAQPGNGYITRLRNTLIVSLESAFYRYGKAIAHRPLHVILFCIVFTALCSLGFLNFTRETELYKLWQPKGSEFVTELEWQVTNVPMDYRVNSAIWEAENVLEKSVLVEMLRVHDLVAKTRTNLANWETVCLKVPTLSFSLFGRKKRYIIERDKTILNISRTSKPLLLSNIRQTRQDGDDGDDDHHDDIVGTEPSTWMSRDLYCNILTLRKQVCMESSILEVFGYDHNYISSLTQEQIIDKINTVSTSAVTGFPMNVSRLLGKVEWDIDGRIIKAGGSEHTWITKVNRTAIEEGNYVKNYGKDKIDFHSFDWEQSFLENIMNDSRRPNGITIYSISSSSYYTISETVVYDDIHHMGFSFILAFFYIIIMIGKFNKVEQRPLLSLFGLISVGLATAVSCGICSLFNVPYGPVNNVMPYLLLGLGIDDMFVIMQAWNTLTPENRQQELPERIGCALRHAGVSITVTSITDFGAFVVGSTTMLPALRYFCIYCAVGIAFVYFFQATLFVACLSIDQRRVEDHRPGLLCCWKLKNWTPNECSQKDLCQRFFSDVYGIFILLPVVKVIVLLATVVLTSMSGWGLSNLQVKYDPIWLVPKDSYVYKYYEKHEYYFPSLVAGVQGSVNFGRINFTADLIKIGELTVLLKSSEYIAEVDSWYDMYKMYWRAQGYDIPDPHQPEDKVLHQVSQFLHSQAGSLYRYRDFHFSSPLNCMEGVPSHTTFRINYKHKTFSTAQQEWEAMDSIREMVRDMNFSGDVHALSHHYGNWVTNRVINNEIYRNMGLTMVMVMLVTCVLISSIVTSGLVMICVMLTLVDVAALMYWWGLTIDTTSYINLVLTIGLCVDYSAHVGHTFLTRSGTRDQRVRSTLATIGTAILNSGITTFLSFIFMANSTSHAFITFFKVFFGVTVFGLYHGLVVLPVLLSLVGPPPYSAVSSTTPATTTTTTGTASAVAGSTSKSRPLDDIQVYGHEIGLIDKKNIKTMLENNYVCSVAVISAMVEDGEVEDDSTLSCSVSDDEGNSVTSIMKTKS